MALEKHTYPYLYQLQRLAAKRKLKVDLGTEKEATQEYFEHIFSTAIIGLNSTDQEPAFNNPTAAVNWKLDRVLRNHEAHLNRSHEQKKKKKPKKVVIFASDVVASDGEQVFHQETREGFLSRTREMELHQRFSKLLDQTGKKKKKKRALEQREIARKLYENSVARAELLTQEHRTPEQRMVLRFKNKREFYWDCGYGYQDQQNRRVTTSFRIGVRLQRPLTDDEVIRAYNPASNMGVGLVELATAQEGASFYILDQVNGEIPITSDQAKTLIVTKAPLEDLLEQMVKTASLNMTTFVPSWAFLAEASGKETASV